jgi:hypothetical protein
MRTNRLADDDLRARARRLVSGDFRTGDLDRLFLGQRSRAHGCACFREIGDFVAHRDTREKGIVTDVGRDVFTSVDVWSMDMRGLKPSAADLARAAYANLRLASNEQLQEGCGCRRAVAGNRLRTALSKLEAGEKPTEAELRVLRYLGNRFIWKPAFTSNQLFTEFEEVLTRNGIIASDEAAQLGSAKAFLSLYALALMHGSSLLLKDNHRARLFAGYANRERRLEVKVEITFTELGTPLMAPICLFLTDLEPEGHTLTSSRLISGCLLIIGPCRWRSGLSADLPRSHDCRTGRRCQSNMVTGRPYAIVMRRPSFSNAATTAVSLHASSAP